MNIGDRVRDKGTEFVGTVVQLDPATGVATRARIQADDLKDGKFNQDRKVGDAPPESMWQRIEEIELIDLEGNGVTGKAGQQLKQGNGETPAKRGETGKSAAAGASATR